MEGIMLYTIEELAEATKNSITLKEIIDKLGLRDHTFYRRQVKADIVKNNIDDSKLDSPRTPARNTNILSLDDILNNKIYLGSHKLKIKLLKNNLISYECSECKLDSWNNKPLSLQLDHIDGNRFNNNLTNLRLLCPNCHSQTETFSNKRAKIIKYCAKCKKSISKRALYCQKCAREENKIFKINWPPLTELVSMIENTSYKDTAKSLGVSDNSIKKHLIRNNVDLTVIKSIKRIRHSGGTNTIRTCVTTSSESCSTN